ncbi:MAG: hypothetical protein R2713_10335 [Ilumatobacteraceae bacterium]
MSLHKTPATPAFTAADTMLDVGAGQQHHGTGARRPAAQLDHQAVARLVGRRFVEHDDGAGVATDGIGSVAHRGDRGDHLEVGLGVEPQLHRLPQHAMLLHDDDGMPTATRWSRWGHVIDGHCGHGVDSPRRVAHGNQAPPSTPAHPGGFPGGALGGGDDPEWHSPTSRVRVTALRTQMHQTHSPVQATSHPLTYGPPK